MQLKESLTLEKPGIFSELVKAQITILLDLLHASSFETRRLIIVFTVVTITFLLTTTLIIILVGPVSHVFQVLLFVSI